jgi:hypothetical protein
MKMTGLVISLLTILLAVGCGNNTDTPTTSRSAMVVTTAPGYTSVTSAAVIKNTPSLTLEKYDGGFFTVDIPANWDVITAGECSTVAVYSYDKTNPANQIFYFGEIGPVYLAEEQKKVDKDYMDMGGYPVSWYEMPVINPLTPENFLSSFHLIAATDIAHGFMSVFPEFNDVEIISTVEEATFITGGQSKTIRALFRQGGQLGEGLFFITVAPLIPLTGMPSGGIGYGFCITGITSARGDFKFYEGTLQQSLNSLAFSPQYIADCMELQRQQGAALVDIGKTLSETSDIIMDSWENRNRSDDILSEKRSDMILGYERVYDPETGTVYEVTPGFYDDYNPNRGQYDMNNLQPLPDNDWGLWTAPTEPGSAIK